MLREERRRRGPRAPRRPGCSGLGHRAELLAHADGLRRRDAERHRGLLRVEARQARARGRGAEHAGRAGDVPAAIVVVRIDRVADAARDVDARARRRRRARARSAPLCSASASAAEATGPAGWMIVRRCVSSKSNVCDEMPFSIAALRHVDPLGCGRRAWPAAPARARSRRRAPLRPSDDAMRRSRSRGS